MERKALMEIIQDDERIRFDNIESAYLSDTLGRLKGNAAALIFAKSTREVSSVLKYAHDNRIPVTPRGAGTNLVELPFP